MKRRSLLKNSCSGFTLFEVIITLVMLGFAGLMLMELTGTALTKSMIPLQWTREEFVLKQRIEELTADYVSWINNNPKDVALVASAFEGIVTGDSNMTSQFIKFTCTGKACVEAPDDTGGNKNMKVTVTQGDMKAVVLYSQIKNDDNMFINY